LEEALIKKTANEVEIAEMLQICSLTEQMAETTIVSIVPEDLISVEVGLSDTVKEAWTAYIGAVLEQLTAGGASQPAARSGMPLDTILQVFAEPSVEHGRGF